MGQCIGKVRYDTVEEANAAKGATLNVYCCSMCQKYHLAAKTTFKQSVADTRAGVQPPTR